MLELNLFIQGRSNQKLRLRGNLRLWHMICPRGVAVAKPFLHMYTLNGRGAPIGSWHHHLMGEKEVDAHVKVCQADLMKCFPLFKVSSQLTTPSVSQRRRTNIKLHISSPFFQPRQTRLCVYKTVASLGLNGNGGLSTRSKENIGRQVTVCTSRTKEEGEMHRIFQWSSVHIIYIKRYVSISSRQLRRWCIYVTLGREVDSFFYDVMCLNMLKGQFIVV